MRGGWSSLGLAVGESVDLTVRGVCMHPLTDGDTVSVRRRWAYLPGDVIVVRRGDHWNAHRFLGYAPSAHGLLALTQADNARDPDPPANAARIVGRARCEVRVSDRVAALGRYMRALNRQLQRQARWAP